MKTDHTLDVVRLRELVDYDPETGVLSRDGRPLAASRAGHYGRIQVCIAGRMYYAARVAYAHFHGCWPEHQIDHINGDHTDQRIANLRDLTGAQNAQNKSRPRRTNSSGLLGVSFDKRNGRYRARIMVGYKMKSLGYYESAEAAHAAYLEAKREVHPYWAGVV